MATTCVVSSSTPLAAVSVSVCWRPGIWNVVLATATNQWCTVTTYSEQLYIGIDKDIPRLHFVPAVSNQASALCEVGLSWLFVAKS